MIGIKLKSCGDMPPPCRGQSGHARGCARERVCPKLDCMWTRKDSFPNPDMPVANEYGKSEAVFVSHIRTRY